MTQTAPHYPVMLPEVLAALQPANGEVYVDGTFGAGGYSTAILESASCHLYGIDRDKSAFTHAAVVSQKFGDRFQMIHGRFSDVETLLAAQNVDAIDGLVVDLGVSSMQLDQAERGFSFRHDAPLDMRMDRDSGEQTAADIVNTLPQDELANLIYQYGDERKSRPIARALVKARAEEPIQTTGRLADIVRTVLPRKPQDQIDPATRTFQALRIAVNDELGEIRRVLRAAERLLRPGGRLVVVSFHSLEDGIVKSFMAERSGRSPRGSRFLPDSGSDHPDPSFTLPSKKAVFPSDNEIAENPRSRSARMRVAVRTAAPAWASAEAEGEEGAA